MANLVPIGDVDEPGSSPNSNLPSELGTLGLHETETIRIMPAEAKPVVLHTNARLSAVKMAETGAHMSGTPVPLQDSSDTLGSFVMCPSPIAVVPPESQVVSTDYIGGTDRLDSVSRAS